MSVDVALVQVRCDDTEPVADRIERTLGLTSQAAVGADLVVLPELWTVGAFDIDAARANLITLDSALIERMRALAADRGVWVHMGSVPEWRKPGVGANTALLIDPRGEVRAAYRKVHLFGFDGGETTVMEAGDELTVVDTPLGPTGLATCYDLRFPEMFRQLCSGWPTRRIEHWRVLTRARAIENQAWLIACNEVGTHAGTFLGGHSMVVDPLGVVVAEGGTDEEIVRARIDPAAASEWRVAFPVLGDRRL